jgi:hypothetical protein
MIGININNKPHSKVYELNEEQINWLDQCTYGFQGQRWKFNRKTGEVNLGGSFECVGQGLTDFKGIRFGVVNGSFNCRFNHLTTLEGAPREIGGGFNCSHNQLKSLEGAPGEIATNFTCGYNQLPSLKGAPKRVKNNFDCTDNQLTTLEGAPQGVGANFICNNNQLTSLKGAPDFIGRGLYCANNQLTSMDGLPLKFGDGSILDFSVNPVSSGVMLAISRRMSLQGNTYLQAVNTLWNEIPLEDQSLLYRQEFHWVSEKERRKLELVKAYQEFKGML